MIGRLWLYAVVGVSVDLALARLLRRDTGDTYLSIASVVAFCVYVTLMELLRVLP